MQTMAKAPVRFHAKGPEKIRAYSLAAASSAPELVRAISMAYSRELPPSSNVHLGPQPLQE